MHLFFDFQGFIRSFGGIVQVWSIHGSYFDFGDTQTI